MTTGGPGTSRKGLHRPEDPRAEGGPQGPLQAGRGAAVRPAVPRAPGRGPPHAAARRREPRQGREHPPGPLLRPGLATCTASGTRASSTRPAGARTAGSPTWSRWTPEARAEAQSGHRRGLGDGIPAGGPGSLPGPRDGPEDQAGRQARRCLPGAEPSRGEAAALSGRGRGWRGCSTRRWGRSDAAPSRKSPIPSAISRRRKRTDRPARRGSECLGLCPDRAGIDPHRRCGPVRGRPWSHPADIIARPARSAGRLLDRDLGRDRPGRDPHAARAEGAAELGACRSNLRGSFASGTTGSTARGRDSERRSQARPSHGHGSSSTRRPDAGSSGPVTGLTVTPPGRDGCRRLGRASIHFYPDLYVYTVRTSMAGISMTESNEDTRIYFASVLDRTYVHLKRRPCLPDASPRSPLWPSRTQREKSPPSSATSRGRKTSNPYPTFGQSWPRTRTTWSWCGFG